MRIAAVLILLLAMSALPQAPAVTQTAADADPAFAMATIQPSDPDSRGRGTSLDGRRYTTLNTTLGFPVQYAYGVHARQIVDAPGWVARDPYHGSTEEQDNHQNRDERIDEQPPLQSGESSDQRKSKRTPLQHT